MFVIKKFNEIYINKKKGGDDGGGKKKKNNEEKNSEEVSVSRGWMQKRKKK